MIAIDYIPGTHGNFLEFALNKLLLGDQIQKFPFNHIGASHAKDDVYNSLRQFECRHWFLEGGCTFSHVIAIKFSIEDLLPLHSVSLLRAGNMNIDDDFLHINTYEKLNNKWYRLVLENLHNNYADAEYPLTPNSPDFPRGRLREFFKFAFQDPLNNGLWQMQQLMQYSHDQTVYEFPYSAFYDKKLFDIEIEKLQQFFKLTWLPVDLTELHEQFLTRQPQCAYKAQCQSLMQLIQERKSATIKLTLFQESYLNSLLEKEYNCEMPVNQDSYFANTIDIVDYLDAIPK